MKPHTQHVRWKVKHQQVGTRQVTLLFVVKTHNTSINQLMRYIEITHLKTASSVQCSIPKVTRSPTIIKSYTFQKLLVLARPFVSCFFHFYFSRFLLLDSQQFVHTHTHTHTHIFLMQKKKKTSQRKGVSIKNCHRPTKYFYK